jgi:pilus assembly protein CpaC
MLVTLIAVVLAVEPVTLAPGAHEVLRFPRLSRVAIADPQVADVTVTRAGELLLVGKHRGRTTLTVWLPSGVVTRPVVVDDARTSELSRSVRALVNPGLKVEEVGGVTIIDGTLDSVEEGRRLQALVGADPNVKVLARLNPRVLPLVAEQITASLAKAGITGARAACVGQQIFLEGSVADEAELNKALMIANAHYGNATHSLSVR